MAAASPTVTLQEQQGQKNAKRGPNYDCYDDLISGLPLELALHPMRLRKYQGTWILEHVLRGNMAAQELFMARPSDVFVASYPKSGTTWVKALTFAVATRTRHPLLTLNPHECVPNLSRSFQLGKDSALQDMASPRILSSYMPHHALPDSIKSSGCRLVYICRDPKDVFVSRWQFNGTMGIEGVAFDKMFEMFCEGVCPFGSLWDHVLGYWREHVRRPDKVLFLKYEELTEDSVGCLTKLAEFIGRPFSEQEVKNGVPAEIAKLCSFGSLKELADKQNRRLPTVMKLRSDSFYRKGAAGDWRNHLSPKMAQRLDVITHEKLEGTGLTLGL